MVQTSIPPDDGADQDGDAPPGQLVTAAVFTVGGSLIVLPAWSQRIDLLPDQETTPGRVTGRDAVGGEPVVWG
jgi:hypothetical protein